MLGTLVSACTSIEERERETGAVVFFDRVGKPNNDPGIIDVFFDQYGDVYSEDEYFPDRLNLVAPDSNSSHLQCYYRSYTSKYDGVSCSLRQRQHAKQWRKEQDQRLRSIAQRIANTVRDQHYANELVLLVHGFNVTYESATNQQNGMYEIAYQKIISARTEGATPVFVRVFFDGGKHSDGADAAPAWLKAQSAAPAIGFRLRRLLNEVTAILNEDASESNVRSLPPLRVLTHSTGAVVIGSLFGDARAALPCLRQNSKTASSRPLTNCSADYDEFREYLENGAPEEYDVPKFPDTRVIMLAPATPPSTFAGSTEYAGLQLGSDHTMVISLRPEDKVLTKTYFSVLGKPISFPVSWGGDTRLGADPKAIKEVIEKRCRSLGTAGEQERLVGQTVAIRMCTQETTLESHSVIDYMSSDGFSEALCILTTDNGDCESTTKVSVQNLESDVVAGLCH